MSNVLPEWYLLRNALFSSCFDQAAELLAKNPGLRDERNGIGETVLHYLAVENFLPGIEWLHARGASLNALNKFGTPLLFEVGLLNYRDLFLWLVRHGADLLQRDSDGATVWEFLAERKRNKFIAFLKSHPEIG